MPVNDMIVPSMELALLRLFQRGGRDNQKLPAHMPEAIFQKDPLQTREMLALAGYFAPGVTVDHFVNLLTEYRESRLKTDSRRRREKAKEVRASQVERGFLTQARAARLSAMDELEVRQKERDKREDVNFSNVWVPTHVPPGTDSASEHSYWLTCLARVCFSHLMLELTPRDSRVDAHVREKTRLWLNAHVPMLEYLDDTAEVKRDADVDPVLFADSYLGVRAADYPEDHDMIQLNTRLLENPRRPTPDAVLMEIEFTLPDLLDQAAEIYRMVEADPHSDIVEWLVLGTDPQDDMGDRTAQADAQRNRYPWFRCKRFIDRQDVLRHSIWVSVLMSLRALGGVRCQGYPDKYKDAAYLWQLAFLELADFCECAKRYDDEFLLTPDPLCEVSPLEAFYPWPARAFHEGDLPNLMPTLMLIALRGEQFVPKFSIGKIINKSLPFACMRRLLTDTTRKAIRSEHHFFRVFSKMMQCMLMGTYPGCRKRLDGDTALAVMRICSSKDALIDKLSISEDQSCRVIFTAVRAYVCEYGRLNPAYADACNDVIYWHGMVRDTRRMGDIIRETNLCALDTFAEARVRLERHGKSSGAIVYRYRDTCVSENLFKIVSKQMEDNVYCELEDERRENVIYESLVRELGDHGRPIDECRELWNQAMLTSHCETLEQMCDPEADPEGTVQVLRRCISINEDSVERFRAPISKQIKENILNTMLHVPENMRFTEPCFSLLCAPEHGGLRRSIVHSLVRLVELYHERGAPKDSEEQLADFSPYELKVVTWFLHCCRLYDRVHLVRLDPVTEERIEHAMLTKRAVVYPKVQQLVANDFNVYVTLCCERVITKMNGAYGHDDVRYDLDLEQPVCKRGNKNSKNAPPRTTRSSGTRCRPRRTRRSVTVPRRTSSTSCASAAPSQSCASTCAGSSWSPAPAAAPRTSTCTAHSAPLSTRWTPWATWLKAGMPASGAWPRIRPCTACTNAPTVTWISRRATWNNRASGWRLRRWCASYASTETRATITTTSPSTHKACGRSSTSARSTTPAPLPFPIREPPIVPEESLLGTWTRPSSSSASEKPRCATPSAP
jgi:hypothetical protein